MEKEGDPDGNHKGGHGEDTEFAELVATQEIKQW
jgi:hypothetical protein